MKDNNDFKSLLSLTCCYSNHFESFKPTFVTKKTFLKMILMISNHFQPKFATNKHLYGGL